MLIVIRIRKVTTWMFMHLSEDILIIMIRISWMFIVIRIVIRIRKVTTWMFMHLSEDILIIMIRGSL